MDDDLESASSLRCLGRKRELLLLLGASNRIEGSQDEVLIIRIRVVDDKDPGCRVCRISLYTHSYSSDL